MRSYFSFAIFVIAATAALPASAQTQQAANVQTPAPAVGPDLSEQAQPTSQTVFTPPGTVDVEPVADSIATHAPRSLHKL
jgi:hypothetical protein